MKRIIIIVAVVAVAIAGFFLLRRGGSQDTGPYRFVTVEQGNLESIVSSTGTLAAVTTVQVGTQVSGIIDKIFVDFNDHVKKGQVIALIDTTLLGSAVREAQANLERSQADLVHSDLEYKRVAALWKQQLVAEVDFNTAQYNLDVARANVSAAENGLERAQRNLDYATIRAPVSGTVIERNVDVGQTVAASLSAPQLFLIANDLSRMQILASVDESDIGQIKPGQDVRFTVQAYPDDVFHGTVRQVRLQSTVEENVVNYSVVVDVANPDGRLLPGMTATVDFIIETASDVYKVSNAALRFRPSEEMLAAFREERQRAREARGDSTRGGPGSAMAAERPQSAGGDSTRAGGRGDNGRNAAGNTAGGSMAGGGGSGFGGGSGGFGGNGGFGGRRSFTLLWTVDASGKVKGLPVRTGITDGQETEIRGRGIEPGMQIITAMTETDDGRSNNPFQQQQGGRRRMGGF